MIVINNSVNIVFMSSYNSMRYKPGVCVQSMFDAGETGPCIYRFFLFRFQICERKTNSFFVFLTSLLKTKNKKGSRFSFFCSQINKDGIYTDPVGIRLIRSVSEGHNSKRLHSTLQHNLLVCI